LFGNKAFFPFLLIFGPKAGVGVKRIEALKKKTNRNNHEMKGDDTHSLTINETDFG
jgi:hypothetical protein